MGVGTIYVYTNTEFKYQKKDELERVAKSNR